MKWMIRMLLICSLLTLQFGAAGSSAQDHSPEDLGSAIDRLTTTVERLTTILDAGTAFESDERETQRVEVAVSILALRYRKIEQLEREIQRISREEEEIPDSMAMMQADVEQYESYARAETGQLSEQDKEGIAAMELRIRLEQDRLDRLAERRLLLENDLAAAQRRLSSIESILDAWLDKLE